MKSYPSSNRGDSEMESPFFDTEQWESEYRNRSNPFSEPQGLFPIDGALGEWHAEDGEVFEDEEYAEEDSEYFYPENWSSETELDDVIVEEMNDENIEFESILLENIDDESVDQYSYDEGEYEDPEDAYSHEIDFHNEADSDDLFLEENDNSDVGSAETDKSCPVCSSALQESEMGGYCASCSSEVAELQWHEDEFSSDLVEDELSGAALTSAVEYNKKKAKNIGWHQHATAIVSDVLKLNYSPNASEFARQVANWQSSKGLDDDGKIGPGTWKKMKMVLGIKDEMPKHRGKMGPLAVIDTRLPDPIGNEYRLRKGSRNMSRQYGISPVIAAVQWIAKEWHKRHPDIIMGIGDISKRGGGGIPPHKSHRLGLDVDVGLVVRGTQTTSEKRIGWYKPRYKAGVDMVSLDDYYSKYQAIMSAFLALVPKNPILPVKVMFYWDHTLSPLVPKGKSSAIHYKHVHIRFCRPPELKSALNGSKVGSSGSRYDCKGQSEFYENDEWSDDYFTDEFNSDIFQEELSGSALASAVQYNRKTSNTLGWNTHFDSIVASVLKLNFSPNEDVFAQKIAEWQNSIGLNDDGKIGPNTWRKIKSVLGLSTGGSSASTSSSLRKKNLAEISKLVESKRGAFGISKSDEKEAARYWYKNTKKHPSPKFRAIKPGNIETYTEQLKGQGAHVEFSSNLFKKTSFNSNNSGNDINFVLAIATREGGAKGLVRTDSTKVSSAGKDTHKVGVSGLDYLWNKRKYFAQAGVFIKPVSKSALVPKRRDREPAYVYAKHLMFSHMVEVARREQNVLNSRLKNALRARGISDSPNAYLSSLNENSRRAWAALTYSGGGFVQSTFSFLIKDQQKRGVNIDFNEIMTHSFSGFKRFHWSKVMLARATSLRAHVFEQVLRL